MAQSVERISLQRLTLRVKLPPALPLRLWAASRLIRFAAAIIGCGISIEHDVARDPR